MSTNEKPSPEIPKDLKSGLPSDIPPTHKFETPILDSALQQPIIPGPNVLGPRVLSRDAKILDDEAVRTIGFEGTDPDVTVSLSDQER